MKKRKTNLFLEGVDMVHQIIDGLFHLAFIIAAYNLVSREINFCVNYNTFFYIFKANGCLRP